MRRAGQGNWNENTRKGEDRIVRRKRKNNRWQRTPYYARGGKTGKGARNRDGEEKVTRKGNEK